MIVIEGTKRRLTQEEASAYKTRYSWVITSPYTYENGDEYIKVPRGFLSDGSTFSPDTGNGWIFHDYLYSTHEFSTGDSCTRVQADRVMLNVLKNTRYENRCFGIYSALYAGAVSMVSYYNPPYAFSSAWASSGARGPEFLDLDDEE